jgi:hypothetical protein
MSTPDRLFGPLAKVERAEHHVKKLAAVIQGFMQTNPYSISREEDAKTGDEVFWVEVSGSPDPTWGAIAGDIVHNLRSALDLLMWQLVEANGNTPNGGTEFPIFDHPVFFNDPKTFKAKVRRKVDGASQPAITLIESIQPYNAGYEPLWIVHRLDIVDKHHVLLPVGAAYHSVDIGSLMAEQMRALTGWDIPEIALGVRPADKLFPLNERQEVFKVVSAARVPNVTHNPKFTFEIAFGDDEVVKGEPMLPTLSNLVEFVSNLIEKFRPLL